MTKSLPFPVINRPGQTLFIDRVPFCGPVHGFMFTLNSYRLPTNDPGLKGRAITRSTLRPFK